MQIDWKNITLERIDLSAWNTLIEKLNSCGLKCLYICRNKDNLYKTTSLKKLRANYFIHAVAESTRAIIFCYDPELKKFRKCMFEAENVSSTTDSEKIKGSVAFDTVSKMFYARTKEKIRNAFNGTNVDLLKLRKRIKRCVISPVTFPKGNVTIFKNNFFKNDVSSAYPYECTKTLPDLSNAVLKKGRHEPSKEFPFAFYLNSRHLKIWNELDTRDIVKSKFYTGQFDKFGNSNFNNISDSEDETLLMPVSKYSLAPEMTTLYNGRKENPEFKDVMNSFLGFMQSNDKSVIPQIPAVVLARCAHRQIKYAEFIEKAGNEVILINTDSVGWIGKPVPEITDSIKKLGAFNSEYAYAEIAMAGNKRYQIKWIDKNGNTCLKNVNAGLSKNESKNMKFGDVLIRSKKQATVLTSYTVNDTGIIKKGTNWNALLK